MRQIAHEGKRLLWPKRRSGDVETLPKFAGIGVDDVRTFKDRGVGSRGWVHSPGFGASTWGMDPVGSAKEAQKICGSGYFLILHPDGSKSCLGSLPPRGQADCPSKSTFRVITGEGACISNLDSPDYISGVRNGDTIPNPCEHDSDCPTSFCSDSGRCAPAPNAQR